MSNEKHRQNKPTLSIQFSNCSDGWILLDLDCGAQHVQIHLSYIYDPLPNLLAWLEAIAIGVSECKFHINEEGAFI